MFGDKMEQKDDFNIQLSCAHGNMKFIRRRQDGRTEMYCQDCDQKIIQECVGELGETKHTEESDAG